MNKTFLTGRLTATPELKSTGSGKAVTSFCLAVYMGKDKDSSFIDCVAWEKTAERICSNCDKGSKVTVEGRLSTRNYEDKNGAKHKVTELTVNEVEFCSANASAPAVEGTLQELPDDDLPF